jgi:ribosomal protein S18 acetylase RimI-like enzyme
MSLAEVPDKEPDSVGKTFSAERGFLSGIEEKAVISSGVEVRKIQPAEIGESLRLLLLEPGIDGLELNRRVNHFQELAVQENYDLTRQVVLSQNGKLVYASLFVRNAGGTAFLFSSPPAVRKRKDLDFFSLSARVLQGLCQWAFEEGSVLLQLLVEPGDGSRQDLCRRSGLRRLTDLLYLFRLSESKIVELPGVSDAEWLGYRSEHHELFKEIILRTYDGSQDCPELEGLRSMEDTLRGHKAGGRFDPRWWKLLLIGGKAAGVLLLMPLRMKDTMELTYMGVCPEYRQQGLGRYLLGEAIASARLSGARCLTLAVDSRNERADHLYRSFGFQEMLRKVVYYRYAGWGKE